MRFTVNRLHNTAHLVQDCGIFGVITRHDLSINSSALRRSGSNYKSLILEHLLSIKFTTMCEIPTRSILEDLCCSILVQVMALWHQATNLYLNECWARSPMACVITRPQSVNTMAGENLVKQWASATTLLGLYWIFHCVHAKGWN